MADKSWRQETEDALRDLYDLSLEEEQTALRIAELDRRRKETVDRVLSGNSTLAAIDTELEYLTPKRSELARKVKSAEAKAKKAGKEFYLGNPDKGVLKDSFAGILQVRHGEKFVVDEPQALEWLRREADSLGERAFQSAVKVDKKGLEKIARKLGGEYGSMPLSEVARWEETATIALQRKKLAEWVPPPAEEPLDMQTVDEAIARLQEEFESPPEQGRSNRFLDAPIDELELEEMDKSHG